MSIRTNEFSTFTIIVMIPMVMAHVIHWYSHKEVKTLFEQLKIQSLKHSSNVLWIKEKREGDSICF